METYKNLEVVANYAYFCSTMLTSKITEIIKSNILNFLSGRIAPLNFF